MPSNSEIERVDELIVLQDAIRALLESGLNLSQVLDRIIEGVVKGLGYKAAMLAVCEGEGEKRVLRATSYAGINPILLMLGQFILRKKIVGQTISLYHPHNLGAQAARDERHAITHDLYDLWRPEVGRFVCRVLQRLQGIKTFVTIPFLSKGKLVGNLFAGTGRSEITDREIELLRSFANQAAIAIENASQHSKAEERLKHVEVLQSNIAALLEVTTNQSEVLQQIIDSVVSGLGYKYAMLAVHDEETNSLRLTHWAGIPERLIAIGEWLEGKSWEDGAISLEDPHNVGAEAAREQEYRITYDLYDLFRPEVRRWLCWLFQRIVRVRTMVTIPFVSRGKLVGNLFAGGEKGEISQDDVETLNAFANQAAIAIENASLFEETQKANKRAQTQLEETQKANKRLRALQDSIAAIHSTLSLQEVLEKIADNMIVGLDYTMAILAVFSEETRKLSFRSIAGIDLHPSQGSQLVDAIKGQGLSLDQTENLAVQAALDQRIKRTDNLYDLLDPVLDRSACLVLQEQANIRTLVTIPLVWEENLVGSLFAGTRKPVVVKEDLDFLQTFASQASVAIHNARLYRSEEERRMEAEALSTIADSVTNMAHDIKSHVNGSIMAIERIRKRIEKGQLKDDEDYLKEKLRMMSDSLGKTKKLFEQLSQPLRERVEKKPTDVNESISQALNSEDIPASIKIKIVLAEDLPKVQASEQLVYVFQNLIRNAKEAMDGTGNLEVYSALEGDNTVTISISDTGPGIPKEDLDRIFERGFTTKEGGEGFGLYWVRVHLRKLGGSIHVESTEGQETKFIVKLPVSQV